VLARRASAAWSSRGDELDGGTPRFRVTQMASYEPVGFESVRPGRIPGIIQFVWDGGRQTCIHVGGCTAAKLHERQLVVMVGHKEADQAADSGKRIQRVQVQPLRSGGTPKCLDQTSQRGEELT
jgi:hypothetical protein